MTKDDARKILTMVETEGWAVLSAHLEAEANAGRDYIMTLMNSKPEALTGKTAMRHGLRVKAYTDLREFVDEGVKLARKS